MRITAKSVSGSSPAKPRGEDAAIRQRNFHSARTVDDVAVGEDEAVRRNDKARARAARFRAGLPCGVGVVHADIHHRGTDLLDHAGDGSGIAVQQFVVAWWRLDRRRRDHGIGVTQRRNQFDCPAPLKCGWDFHRDVSIDG